MAEEKRIARRIHKRFILRAALFGEKPLRWSHVTIHNLSSTGAFFTFDRQVQIGDLLYFKIDFPDRVIQCMGRVRRMCGRPEGGEYHDVGASFEGIESEDRRYIDSFVERAAGA